MSTRFLGLAPEDWWSLVVWPYAHYPHTSYLVLYISTALLSLMLLLYAVCLFFVFGTIPETVKVGGSPVTIHPTSAFLFSLRVLFPLVVVAGCIEFFSPALAPYLRVPVPTLKVDRFLGSLVLLFGFHATTFFLYAVLPARVVRGYVLEPGTGDPAPYRLPGFLLLLVSVTLWAAGVRSGVLPSAVLQWQCRVEAAAASFVLGVLLAAAFYLRGLRARDGFDKRARCPTVDMVVKGGGPLPPPKKAETAEFIARSPLDHFYCGAWSSPPSPPRPPPRFPARTRTPPNPPPPPPSRLERVQHPLVGRGLEDVAVCHRCSAAAAGRASGAGGGRGGGRRPQQCAAVAARALRGRLSHAVYR